MIRVDPDGEELGRGKQKSKKKNAGIELTDMVVGCCNGRSGAKACEGSEGSVGTDVSLVVCGSGGGRLKGYKKSGGTESTKVHLLSSAREKTPTS